MWLKNKITIYNRWEDPVFISENYKNDWRGENPVVGTYFYRIEPLDVCEEQRTGWVQIM